MDSDFSTAGLERLVGITKELDLDDQRCLRHRATYRHRPEITAPLVLSLIQQRPDFEPFVSSFALSGDKFFAGAEGLSGPAYLAAAPACGPAKPGGLDTAER